ncbi:HigA family addiction module antidote protein [Candidatus Dojkabacteria bacterium]|nr:HigA family addiction module antidote protein [Candidatus Dojkabacteria bacterium]
MTKLLELVTPGEILFEEFLKPNSINQNQLAQRLNVPANRINQIVNGKREITADTALRLARFFGTSPEFWLNLQSHYNLEKAERESGKFIMEITPVSENLNTVNVGLK